MKLQTPIAAYPWIFIHDLTFRSELLFTLGLNPYACGMTTVVERIASIVANACLPVPAANLTMDWTMHTVDENHACVLDVPVP